MILLGPQSNDRTLEELDGSEAKLMLLDLPPMDVDRVSFARGSLVDGSFSRMLAT